MLKVLSKTGSNANHDVKNSLEGQAGYVEKPICFKKSCTMGHD